MIFWTCLFLPISIYLVYKFSSKKIDRSFIVFDSFMVILCSFFLGIIVIIITTVSLQETKREVVKTVNSIEVIKELSTQATKTSIEDSNTRLEFVKYYNTIDPKYQYLLPAIYNIEKENKNNQRQAKTEIEIFINKDFSNLK